MQDQRRFAAPAGPPQDVTEEARRTPPPGAEAKPSLTLKKWLKATPAKVFEAWIDPARMMRFWGGDKCEVRHAEADARVGGRFRVVMREKASGEDHDVSGLYREVVPHETLVFTWAWRSTPERESLVTIRLRPDGDGTMLTLVHEQFFDEAARDGHRHGWTDTLEKLETVLA